MNRAVISTRFLADFAQLARELGADPDKIIGSVGLTPGAITGADIDIDYRQYAALLANAAVMTGCPHFGLLLGTRHDLSILGAIGILAKHCESLGEALEVGCRYYSLLSRSSQYRLVARERQVLLVREPTVSALSHDIQVQDVSLCEACQVVRSIAGQRWRPGAVYFTHPAPAITDVYRATFGCEVLFDREIQALALSPADMSRPLAQADADTRRFMERELAGQLAARHADLDLRTSDAIRLLLATGRCTVETVSEHLGLHSRTLHRKLRQQGTTFTELLEQVRRQLATELLAGTTMDVQRISELLGYSDATAFGRAFRRWMGQTPARWRQRPGG